MSDDPECKLPIAGEKGYLMGDPSIDMIKRYQAYGIVIPDKYSSMPDHLTLASLSLLEMNYLGYYAHSVSLLITIQNMILSYINSLANA